MNHKTGRIEEWVAQFQGREASPYFLGYLHCFNQQEFFEAHEVLEAAWLPARRAPAGNFYKGLIQLAGAYVHIQKGRPGPAVALFTLAERNLQPFAPEHQQFDVAETLRLIAEWKRRVGAGEVVVEGGGRVRGAPVLALKGSPA